MSDFYEDSLAQRQTAAGDWYSEEMELCQGCERYVPWEELESLIGHPPRCFLCRSKIQEARLNELLGDGSTSGLGIS